MNINFKSLPAATSSVTVDDILDATEIDGSWLTLEEILQAPIGEIESELAARGWDDFKIDEDRLAEALRHPPLPLELDQPDPPPAAPLPFPVERPGLLRELHARAMSHTPLLIIGTVGCGKSHVINQLLRDELTRHELRRVIHIDCAALRMGDPIMLGREAVWAHFGTNDGGYKRFVANLSADEHKTNALTALMETHLQPGGMIVLDHAEHLNDSNEIDLWLAGQLLPRAKAIGAKVLIAHRWPVAQLRPALRDLARFHLPDISKAEIGEWLQRQPFAALKASGLSETAIVHFTGGRPSLLRDLGLFIRHNPRFNGNAVLRAFVRWRSRDHQFFVECERLTRAARCFPDVIERVLTSGGLSKPWPEHELSSEAVNALLATGAVRRGKLGTIELASPLYAHRLQRLARPDALSALSVRTNFSSIERSSSWKTLRKFGELASDAIAKSLGYESSPLIGLQRLINFLKRWDFEAQIFIRDQDIARLWAPLQQPDKIGPLESWKQPDFARAVQTGQLVRAEDGRIFVPVISYTGNATMVIVLRFLKAQPPAPCARQVDIERVTGMIEGIEPTLAQLVQRMTLRRDRKFQGKLWYRSKLPGTLTGRDSLLREVGCQAIIVLEKSNRAGWIVSRFQRTGDTDDGSRWAEVFNVPRLDAIARHRSKRGLVLSGDNAAEAFPRLFGRDVAVYLHPVKRDGGTAIVVFLFEGDAAALDGHVQTQLSVYAPDMLRVAC